MSLNGDEIWNYGFCYNISFGLIPYKDFNLIVTPLYHFFGAFFIKIFGNYLISLDMLNSIIIGIMMLILYQMIKYKSFIVYPFIIYFSVSSYNLLCLFFLVIIMYLINVKKDNEVVMAIVVGLLFLCKQSIGFFLLIPMIFYAKNRKKSICCFMLPISFFLFYLIYNDALFDFINYCFLGLFDFSEANGSYNTIFFYLEIIISMYLLLNILISKFKDRSAIYILLSQIICYPIFDIYHFFIVLPLIVYYFIKNINNKYILTILFFSVYFFFFLLIIQTDIEIMYEKNYLYLRNVSLVDDYVDSEKETIDKYYNKYDYSFFFLQNAYLIKLYMNIEINKYDLLNNGNLGYNGDEVYISEIDKLCSNSSCVFFVDEIDWDIYQGQLSEKIYDYILENYYEIDDGVYSN